MRRLLFALLAAVAITSACGGDGGSTGPSTVTLPNGTFSGTVNQAPYAPAAVFVTHQSGIIALGSTDLAGRSLGFAFFVTGAGTFTMSESGNTATWSEGGLGWAAGGNLGSGSLTITTLNATKAVGSFILALQPVGHVAQPKSITGTFDILLD